MYGDRVRQFQFLQLFEGIYSKSSIFKFYFCSFRKFIDLLKDSGISVKNTNPFLYHNSVSSADLPFHLVIIPDLHHLITLTEQPVTQSMFLSGTVRWV